MASLLTELLALLPSIGCPCTALPSPRPHLPCLPSLTLLAARLCHHPMHAGR